MCYMVPHIWGRNPLQKVMGTVQTKILISKKLAPNSGHLPIICEYDAAFDFIIKGNNCTCTSNQIQLWAIPCDSTAFRLLLLCKILS